MLNGVDEITIDPTVNESNATVEYLDSSDTEIADANSGKTGHQVSLDEGANTIKVKVTAQDVTTTNTYTVVVTRAAANNAAMGAPTITGTAQVDQTLTPRPRHHHGLTSVTYTYQWIRANGTEADIAARIQAPTSWSPPTWARPSRS